MARSQQKAYSTAQKTVHPHPHHQSQTPFALHGPCPGSAPVEGATCSSHELAKASRLPDLAAGLGVRNQGQPCKKEVCKRIPARWILSKTRSKSRTLCVGVSPSLLAENRVLGLGFGITDAAKPKSRCVPTLWSGLRMALHIKSLGQRRILRS